MLYSFMNIPNTTCQTNTQRTFIDYLITFLEKNNTSGTFSPNKQEHIKIGLNVQQKPSTDQRTEINVTIDFA